MDRKFSLSSLVFILSFLLYLFSLAPGVTFEDSGELIASAYVLGNAHPPGYPLFSLIGHIFSSFPSGNVAWNLNLMSAFFSSLALAGFFILFSSVLKSFLIPFLSVLLFAVSRTLWTHSTITEVYALNLFLFVLANLLVFRYIKNPNLSVRNLWAVAFIVGIATSNHQTILLAVPGLGIALLVSSRFKGLKWGGILGTVPFFLLGFLVYLYLPIRAVASPPMNWGSPGSLSSFLDVLLRRQYGGVWFDGFGFLLGLKQILIVNPVYELFGIRDLHEGGSRLVHIVLWPVAWGLVIYAFLKDKNREFKFTALSHAFFFTVFIIFLSNTPKDKEFTLKVFFLPFWAFYFFYLMQGLWDLVSKVRFRAFPIVLSIIFILTVAFFNSLHCNNRRYFYCIDYVKNVFQSAPQASLIVTKKDNETFNLWYAQMVEKQRPDVWVINYITLSEYWYIRYLEKTYPGFSITTRPSVGWTKKKTRDHILNEIISRYGEAKPVLFANKEIPVPEGKQLVPFGVAYRVTEEGESVGYPEGNPLFQFRGLSPGNRFDVMTLLMLQNLSFIASDTGMMYYENKDYQKAVPFFQKSIDLNKLIGFEPNNFQNYQILGMIHSRQGDAEGAFKFWEQAVASQPSSPSGQALALELQSMKKTSTELIKAEEAYKNGNYRDAIEFYKKELERNRTAKLAGNIGDCFFNLGNYTEAIAWYEKAIFTDHNYGNAYYNLGGSYLMLNQAKKAEEVWKEGLRVNPENSLIRDAMKKYLGK